MNKINAATIGISMPTWGVWGFVEYESYVNMSGEAHVVTTSPCRGDTAEWDAVAAADYTDLSNPWGPPVPPTPPGPGPAPLPDPLLSE